MLPQTATYAVRAMGYLATHGGDRPVLSQTIAEAMEIPKNFLSKILHRLVKEGIVKSVRGTHGGFVLARDARAITLREVAAPFMNLAAYRNCFLGLHECDGSCGTHRKWLPVVHGLERLLDDTTIDKVL
jgi:Rrf2 family protein